MLSECFKKLICGKSEWGGVVLSDKYELKWKIDKLIHNSSNSFRSKLEQWKVDAFVLQPNEGKVIVWKFDENKFL